MQNKLTIGLFIATICIAMTGCSNASEAVNNDKIEQLMKEMTLEEKVGQLNQYNGFWDATGPVPNKGKEKIKYQHLTKGLVGSVLNVSGFDKVREMQKTVVEQTRLGIPLLFAMDVIHGHRTVFPIPLAEAASWDLELIEKSARIAAIEASARGINWTFAPMLDISRDPRWGRVMEGSGEDPYLGSKVGVARVKGFQGKDLSKNNTIVATAKHLAGYGFVEAGRDYNRADISQETLYNVVLPPFKSAVEAGIGSIMNSFNSLNGIPATGSKFLQRDIVKKEWGFNGVIVSDWASIQEMVAHGYARDLKHATELAIKAGSDVDMESWAYVTYLKELVESGAVDIALVDDAVRRILTLKLKLGLFDDPYRYVNQKREEELVNHPDHHKAALKVASSSIVLLKNENAVLPLSNKKQSIAVIGDLADDKNSPLGSWRFGSVDHSAVSLVEGIKKHTSNYTFAQGTTLVNGRESFMHAIDINTTDKSGFAEAVALAKKSDVVVMMLGEHGFQTGEGRSRVNLDLPGLQQELLEAVYAVNKNIVLLVASGRPLILSWADKHIPTILATWQLGSQSGNAIADVLFGEYNPSGKLPVSFPRSVGQIPIYYNRFSTGRPTPQADSPDMVFWSHYADQSSEPLYSFGHGLSYSTFKYSNLSIDDSNKMAIKVSVNVKNTGDYDGNEVVQLYTQDLVASLIRPIKELKGFKKIWLKKGESQTVDFTLTDKELGFYNNSGEFIVEKGLFNVMVGTSSDEGLKGQLSR